MVHKKLEGAPTTTVFVFGVGVHAINTCCALNTERAQKNVELENASVKHYDVFLRNTIFTLSERIFFHGQTFSFGSEKLD